MKRVSSEGMETDSWSPLDFFSVQEQIPQQRIDMKNMARHPEIIVYVTAHGLLVGW